MLTRAEQDFKAGLPQREIKQAMHKKSMVCSEKTVNSNVRYVCSVVDMHTHPNGPLSPLVLTVTCKAQHCKVL